MKLSLAMRFSTVILALSAGATGAQAATSGEAIAPTITRTLAANAGAYCNAPGYADRTAYFNVGGVSGFNNTTSKNPVFCSIPSPGNVSELTLSAYYLEGGGIHQQPLTCTAKLPVSDMQPIFNLSFASTKTIAFNQGSVNIKKMIFNPEDFYDDATVFPGDTIDVYCDLPLSLTLGKIEISYVERSP